MKNEEKVITVKDGDLMSAIAEALRLAADSKAKKDWENKQSPIEDRRDC